MLEVVAVKLERAVVVPEIEVHLHRFVRPQQEGVFLSNAVALVPTGQIIYDLNRRQALRTVNLTIRAMQPFLERYIPDIEIVHLCDDTIQRDNISAGVGVIPKRNYFKFAQYAHNLQEAGADMILLACSTFNYAAELARPMIDIPIMQIDRPMMELAVGQGRRVGLLATLSTTVPSLSFILARGLKTPFSYFASITISPASAVIS